MSCCYDNQNRSFSPSRFRYTSLIGCWDAPIWPTQSSSSYLVFMTHPARLRPSSMFVFIIRRKPILRSYEITFLEITSANRNRLGRSFTRDVGTLPCKLLVPFSAKRVQNGAENNARSERSVSKTTHRFTQFPEDDFREVWTQNVNRCHHEFFQNRIEKCFR